MKKLGTRGFVALLGVALLGLSACGDDDEATSATDAAPVTQAATTAAAAAETSAAATETSAAATATSAAATETSAAASNSSAPAAGAVDALAPKPLPERKKITVGMSGKIENYLPIFLADDYGEFEKENIDVEFTFAPPTDQVQ